MHVIQLSLVPMSQQQPLPPPTSVNPFIIQQLLESQANIMPWCEGFYGLPFCAGPVYQAMAQQHQHQYRARSSGPSRSQHSKRFRKAETQYRHHNIHELSGMIAEDHSTGTHPGHAWIGANDNTGVGKVWRTPSKNPLMVDCNLNLADTDKTIQQRSF